MLKELIFKLFVSFENSYDDLKEFFNKSIQQSILEKQQKLKRKLELKLYYESIKCSPLHKHQIPRLKLLYAVNTIKIIPLLTVLNCSISYKICFNTKLTLRSRILTTGGVYSVKNINSYNMDYFCKLGGNYCGN